MYDPDLLRGPLGEWSEVEPGSTSRQREHMLFDNGDVAIGFWEVTPGRFANHLDDFDELMLMASGRLSVDLPDGSMIDVAPGTAWVTPRFFPCSWTVHQTVRKLFVIDSRPGGPASLAVVPNVWTHPLGDQVLHPRVDGGEPMMSEHELWKANGLEIGLWACTPGSFATHRDGFDEVVHILEGSGHIIGADGVAFELRPGATVVLPNGYRGRWEIAAPLRKLYCLVHR
jgi:uncharacterized protein